MYQAVPSFSTPIWGGCQGNRMLIAWKTGVDGVESLLVPAGAESFARSVLFDGSVSLQNVERHAAVDAGDLR